MNKLVTRNLNIKRGLAQGVGGGERHVLWLEPVSYQIFPIYSTNTKYATKFLGKMSRKLLLQPF